VHVDGDDITLVAMVTTASEEMNATDNTLVVDVPLRHVVNTALSG